MTGMPGFAHRPALALLIMHSVGSPKIAHTHVIYQDAIGELLRFFREKISLAERAGVPRDAIVLDPGIDFAKQADDNLRILRELERFRQFEPPAPSPGFAQEPDRGRFSA